MACGLRETRSCASSPANTSRRRWSSSATAAGRPDQSPGMKEAAPAAHANLDGVTSAPMPPVLRYLDEDGELLVTDLPMSDQVALEGYRVMLRGRRFDERSVSLDRKSTRLNSSH